MNIIKIEPQTRFNNLLFLNEKQHRTYVNNNIFFKNSFYSHDLCSVSDKEIQNHFKNNFSFVKRSFVYLITETVAEYPYPFLTEKTWKAIVYKMPFMIVGGKHSLKCLRSFGFKTFENFWDEEYDNLDYAADRIDKITDNLQILALLNQTEIDNLYKKMLPLLEHNFNHLNYFYKKQIFDIKEKLRDL
jgi:hypothetical protein